MHNSFDEFDYRYDPIFENLYLQRKILNYSSPYLTKKIKKKFFVILKPEPFLWSAVLRGNHHDKHSCCSCEMQFPPAYVSISFHASNLQF